MTNQLYNIILADDHEILIDSLASLLNNEEKFNVIAKVGNGKDLIKKTVELKPDLCVVDMDMPIMNGLEASEKLLNQFPTIKILILTMHKEKSLVRKMMQLGIKGYLLKTCDSDEFIFAINQLLKGKTHFTDEVVQNVINKKPVDSDDIVKISNLSDREKEIIQLLCQGLSNKQIGEKLFLSYKTVDNHRTNIMRKLDVHNVVELIRFSLKNNLAD